MNTEEILGKLNDIFARVLNEEVNLTTETTAADVRNWDSLSHVMLVVEIESSFGKRFAAREIQNWKSVGDIVASLQA